MQALFSTQYFISDVRLKTQFIVHCCAKIIKSDAGSNHCAIQRKLGGAKISFHIRISCTTYVV